MVAWTEYRDIARKRGALALELYVVESTPNDPEKLSGILPDHLAYQRELEASGRLVMAGPLSDEAGEEMTGAGLIVYRASSLDEARAIAKADPMHKSGARSFRLRRWLVNEGRLHIDVGLSTGLATLS
ncbi:MAG: hypothetical protein D6688_04500 [Alphaproteobacteria bacterium]|nr:MAG: hypothetical protein D6688_04500 [Alphaproteobacteria bacterium]